MKQFLSKLRISAIKSVIDFIERATFEREILAYYRNASNINMVIDVGANKGQSIDIFLKVNPKCTIYAIEPNPQLFFGLKSKYGKYENVKLFNIGISETSGEKLFFENVLDYTSSFEELNYESGYLEKKAKILGIKKENIISKQYPVQVKSLYDFIKENKISGKIDIVKIDTEGHEYYCLKGLFTGTSSYDIRFIQLENHNDDMYVNKIEFKEIDGLLAKNEFRVTKKIKHGFGDFEELVYSRNTSEL